MNTSFDTYFLEGCGRCDLGGTPACKVHKWTSELALLRRIVGECGLVEECKWGVPCYTFQNKNVLIVSAFNDFCSINFFKGALLNDAKKLLVKPGENTQAARSFQFTDTAQIKVIENDIKAYIFEAIEVERLGLKVVVENQPELTCEELEHQFDENDALKSAFLALTPGRQKGYLLFFTAPKQSKTRLARIQKSIDKILNGEGLNDGYKK